jgi:hypothetical protein
LEPCLLYFACFYALAKPNFKFSLFFIPIILRFVSLIYFSEKIVAYSQLGCLNKFSSCFISVQVTFRFFSLNLNVLLTNFCFFTAVFFELKTQRRTLYCTLIFHFCCSNHVGNSQEELVNGYVVIKLSSMNQLDRCVCSKLVIPPTPFFTAACRLMA